MSINISELIWTVICFFVLLVVLKKLLFDPLVSFMAARDARIQDGLNAGRTAQQQLDAAARVRSEAQRKQAAAADALLAALAAEGAERGHGLLNLGLGIHPGVAFFKKKWGASAFLPCVETSWTLQKKGWLTRLLGR